MMMFNNLQVLLQPQGHRVMKLLKELLCHMGINRIISVLYSVSNCLNILLYFFPNKGFSDSVDIDLWTFGGHLFISYLLHFYE